jgi:hypothetical protein
MRFALRSSRASISATISSMLQNFVVTPAAIAGVTLSVLWMRQKVVEHEIQRQRVAVIFQLL